MAVLKSFENVFAISKPAAALCSSLNNLVFLFLRANYLVLALVPGGTIIITKPFDHDLNQWFDFDKILHINYFWIS